MDISILRTRFKEDIVCEFLPPERASHKVIIFATGMPSYPGRRDDFLRFFAARGYWVFLPRYRGSWESDGRFLKISPEQDLLDIAEELPKGFIDIWNGREYRVEKPEIFIIGCSFGGAAALLASRDKRVKKVVALSPVIDWEVELRRDSMHWLEEFMDQAFGNAYRFGVREWKKLRSGTFYNPMMHMGEFDGKKILIFQAKNDDIVFYDIAKEFADKTKSSLVSLKRDGHLSLSNASRAKFWKRIARYFGT